MKLAFKILLAVFVITGAGFYYLTIGMVDDIRTRYLEGVEETLVDQSRILAAFISHDLETRGFSTSDLHQVFDSIYKEHFITRIYHLKKTQVDLRVYITDEKGFVIFDSTGKAMIGEDYSKWRDVYLTLRGLYGARSSREDDRKEASSVLYVAAPITVDGVIKGVLTVAKPTTGINTFIERAKTNLKLKSTLVVSLVLILSVFAVTTFTRPIKDLTNYAVDIREGRKADLPKLDKSEIGDMGRAFESMREALENRKYVEQYVQTLTHEIKSPLSAIKGAAELLEEPMERDQRIRFLANIRTESERIQHLVDRMLELSAIENLKALKVEKEVDFKALIESELKRMGPVLEAGQITLKRKFPPQKVTVTGDPYLLKQALSNLIKNSVDFSPRQARIFIGLLGDERRVTFVIQDQGPGFPDYAADKLFDKFFSLRRPDSGKKSTGLGLNVVREVAALHRGRIKLENRPEGGARATLTLPVRRKPDPA